MLPNTKSFILGFAIGVSAFLFLTRSSFASNEKNNKGISKYWSNVGEYLSRGIKKYEE